VASLVTQNQWFASLLHARTEIGTWRREYNEERPKKAPEGLTSTDYDRSLCRLCPFTSKCALGH
jgi:hypothetical protein